MSVIVGTNHTMIWNKNKAIKLETSTSSFHQVSKVYPIYTMRKILAGMTSRFAAYISVRKIRSVAGGRTISLPGKHYSISGSQNV